MALLAVKQEGTLTAIYTTFFSKVQNSNFADVYDIDPKELSTKADEVVMIDVRQPEEYVGELGHIDGARLVVLDSLAERLQELPKDKTIVFICLAGGRSARASAFALQNGFISVYNMQGGMLSWNELNLPITKKVN